MIGTYLLVLKVRNDSKIKIGRIGKTSFYKGYYFYVGSAFGKRISLENRINRYKKLCKNKKGKLRWHIDYFLVNPNVLIEELIMFNNQKIECKISNTLKKHAKAWIDGFGCSDCKCESHLYYFDKKTDIKKLIKIKEIYS